MTGLIENFLRTQGHASETHGFFRDGKPRIFEATPFWHSASYVSSAAAQLAGLDIQHILGPQSTCGGNGSLMLRKERMAQASTEQQNQVVAILLALEAQGKRTKQTEAELKVALNLLCGPHAGHITLHYRAHKNRYEAYIDLKLEAPPQGFLAGLGRLFGVLPSREAHEAASLRYAQGLVTGVWGGLAWSVAGGGLTGATHEFCGHKGGLVSASFDPIAAVYIIGTAHARNRRLIHQAGPS